jgi:hypothetical protein
MEGAQSLKAQRALVTRRQRAADYVHGQTLFVDGGMTLYPEFARGS